MADDLQWSEDALLGGAVTIRQPRTGYRVSSDAVLLAALTPVAPGQRVLDLGTGYGQVALSLLAREPTLQVVGLELLPEVAALAVENARLNHLADRFAVRVGSVAASVFSRDFDVVVCNPPYRRAQTHTASANRIKAAATVESPEVPLICWTQAAAQALKPAGVLVLVHDAARESDLLQALAESGLGRVELLPLLPRAGVAAKRLVVRARCGVLQKPVRLPGLVLHEEDGRWCAAVEATLRQPSALPWGFPASD